MISTAAAKAAGRKVYLRLRRQGRPEEEARRDAQAAGRSEKDAASLDAAADKLDGSR